MVEIMYTDSRGLSESPEILVSTRLGYTIDSLLVRTQTVEDISRLRRKRKRPILLSGRRGVPFQEKLPGRVARLVFDRLPPSGNLSM